ncbi:hypothetical protein [Mucilaginibacter sp. AK015]|uniref:hypothetical protein n=1 Tax=Mucilaginibacter sp. AK015 TaxID=2723072 RepID=UPI001621AFA3|nr:hypothetical protein [Mucilaginibacter sp. AK015]MBB5395093.1 hypothetical protein [Mucilaginibacter sp. AK015]
MEEKWTHVCSCDYHPRMILIISQENETPLPQPPLLCRVLVLNEMFCRLFALSVPYDMGIFDLVLVLFENACKIAISDKHDDCYLRITPR